MAQSSARVICSRCGANNFETVSACWKCSAPLGAPTMAAAPTLAPPVYAPSQPERMPMTAPAPMAAVAPSTGDSGVAKRAALALALTLPWIGLPVGWIFMMIEDHRRQAVGRFCVVWSFVGLVLHLFVMYLGVASLTALSLKLLSSMAANSLPRTSPSYGDTMEFNSGGGIGGGVRQSGGFGGR